jgi:hypothetical protein
MTSRQPGTALAAALRYASHGWPVFPCIPGEKIPVTKHGFLEATTDTGTITRWWTANEARNVAIATGAPGPDVLDVDQHGEHGNGFAALNQLKRRGLAEGASAVIRTPSGGLHLYFAGTAQRNGHLAAQHLDYRACGGYVLAPPSTVNGRPYEVIRHQASTATLDWSAARELLVPAETRPHRSPAQADGPTDIAHLAGFVARLQPGNRNGGLHWAACRAAEAGVLDADAVEQFVRASLQSGIRGGEREARKTILSALRGRGLDPTREREAG